MRTGSRLVIACLLVFAALCSPALAADSLTVFVDSNKVALGATTMLAAHAETDASYGGGHVLWKYEPAAHDCAATPDMDQGTDANGSTPAVVNAGAGSTDVGGQGIQLKVGIWRICGWLVDTSTGGTVASGSTVVTVLPYVGSVSLSVQRIATVFQIVISYDTSAPGNLYAWAQKAHRACRRKPPHHALLLVPRRGRFVGGDGGLGRSLAVKRLAPGRWRVCGSLVTRVGHAGPATKTFSVRRRRVAHAGG